MSMGSSRDSTGREMYSKSPESLVTANDRSFLEASAYAVTLFPTGSAMESFFLGPVGGVGGSCWVSVELVLSTTMVLSGPAVSVCASGPGGGRLLTLAAWVEDFDILGTNRS